MQNFTRKIWQSNKSAFIFVTHDVDEVLAPGTRIIVMSRRPGQIVAEFNVDFTNNCNDKNLPDIQFSGEYLEARKKVLEVINAEADTM